jgi:hypothetical protein
MPKKIRRSKARDSAHLIAYDAKDRVVEELKLGFLEYYEELHPLVDENEYRRKRGIRRMAGVLYDSSGTRTQSFEVRYTAKGAYLSMVARHADGTVVEDQA